MLPPDGNSSAIIRDRIVSSPSAKDRYSCVLAGDTKILLHPKPAGHVAIVTKSQWRFHMSMRVARRHSSPSAQVPGGKPAFTWRRQNMPQPRTDRRGQSFVSARVRKVSLGVSNVFLPCAAVREYFFDIGDRPAFPTFYEVLRIAATSSPSEIRVAFKLRTLELKAVGADRIERIKLERAFNTLGHPELRVYYDSLLSHADLPAMFPYGFGSLLVVGERPDNIGTFFARRIIAFVPERTHRCIQVLLRHCEFYVDTALCRDSRRKLQFWLDSALAPVLMGPKLESLEAFAEREN